MAHGDRLVGLGGLGVMFFFSCVALAQVNDGPDLPFCFNLRQGGWKGGSCVCVSYAGKRDNADTNNSSCRPP